MFALVLLLQGTMSCNDLCAPDVREIVPLWLQIRQGFRSVLGLMAYCLVVDLCMSHLFGARRVAQ